VTTRHLATAATSEISFYDTATLPTEAMRDAMRDARLGDDMYGADPTVNELEAEVARLLGKEAAVLVPSGTMANLIALMVLCRPGDEAVVEAEAHVAYYEAGGMAALAGVMPLAVGGDHGVLNAELVEPHLRKPNQHFPRTTLVVVENTHNRAGGTVTTPADMAGLRELCDRHRLALHVDGARLLNAATALGITASRLAEHADSVTVCLSKGLSAPAGSLLAGSGDYIARARRARKLLGGAMRQSGVLAAAGLVAIREQIPALAADHRRAAQLADELAVIDGICVDSPAIRTNMVMVDTSATGIPAEDVAARLADEGIRASSRPPWAIRFVTHRQIGDGEVRRLVGALRRLVDA
jgi:threonine aldolase